MKTSKCHICKKEIIVSVTAEEYDDGKGIKPTGTDTTVGGSFGHIMMIPAKPICHECADTRDRASRIRKLQIISNKILKHVHPMYQCPLHDISLHPCDGSFKTKGDLKDHLKLKHEHEIQDLQVALEILKTKDVKRTKEESIS